MRASSMHEDLMCMCRCVPSENARRVREHGHRAGKHFWHVSLRGVTYGILCSLFDFFFPSPRGADPVPYINGSPCRRVRTKKSKSEHKILGVTNWSDTSILTLWESSDTRLHQYWSHTYLNVDGHLRLRTPYPVRSVKLSSLKLG